MLQSRSLRLVDFVLSNTDAQALLTSTQPTQNTNGRIHKFQLGPSITHGLGAGANPSIGASAAAESLRPLLDHVLLTNKANLVFVAAGLGGGTGSGAAPVLASALRSAGVLTIGVVTTPFTFEGSVRANIARDALARMNDAVDTLLVVPNQRLLDYASSSESLRKLTLKDAFKMSDEVLADGVSALAELIVTPGLINLDFADVCTICKSSGRALFGTAFAKGEPGSGRAQQAAEAALKNPLLVDTDVRGGRGVLISIAGGADVTLHEVDAVASTVRKAVGNEEAEIIFGSAINDELSGGVRVSVVVTGVQQSGNGNTASSSSSPSSSSSAVPQSHTSTPISTINTSRHPSVKAKQGKVESTVISSSVETETAQPEKKMEEEKEKEPPKKKGFFRRHW
jgi:cell division protein FtsZ